MTAHDILRTAKQADNSTNEQHMRSYKNLIRDCKDYLKRLEANDIEEYDLLEIESVKQDIEYYKIMIKKLNQD